MVFANRQLTVVVVFVAKVIHNYSTIKWGLVVVNHALTRVHVFLRAENRVKIVARSNGQVLVR